MDGWSLFMKNHHKDTCGDRTHFHLITIIVVKEGVVNPQLLEKEKYRLGLYISWSQVDYKCK